MLVYKCVNEPKGRVDLIFDAALSIFCYCFNFLQNVLHLTFKRQFLLFYPSCCERRYLCHTWLHPSLIYYSLPTKAPSLIKNNGNFRSLSISGEKAMLLKSQEKIVGAILHLKCMMAIVGKKSYCHSERSLYKNLVSSSLLASVHGFCH